MTETKTSRLFEELKRRAAEKPSGTAVLDVRTGSRHTFAELVAESLRLATDLPDTRGAVALAVDNGLVTPWFFALRAAGRPVALMDPQPTVDEKRQMCRRLGIETLIHCRDGEAELEAVPGVDLTAPLPGVEIVKLTSGSTGAPTGLCFAEEDLIQGFRHLADGMEIDGNDRVLVVIPLTHSYGFDNGLLSLALAGTPLILESRIFPRHLHRAIEAGEVTFLPLVPPLVGALGRVEWPRLPSLRRVICAGGVLAPDLAAAFHRASGLYVHNFYGSSETGGICFETRPEQAAAVGTVGSPLPGVDVRLDAHGRAVVRSPANRRALWGAERLLRDDERAVVTGDLAELSGGRLRLVGRATRRLNIGGRKVAAEVVEAELRRLPGVDDAAVIGLADAMRGDRVVAFLVTGEWPIDLSSMSFRLRPRECRRVDELPVNARGKVDRRLLETWAAQPAGEPTVAPTLP